MVSRAKPPSARHCSVVIVMTRITIVHTQEGGYTLESIWNGTVYALHHPDGSKLVFAGDAAADFREELDDLTGPVGLQLHMQEALSAIWYNYH